MLVQDIKRCSKCGENKPLDEFRRSSRSRDGHKPNCRLCANQQAEQWRARPLPTETVRCAHCGTPFDRSVQYKPKRFCSSRCGRESYWASRRVSPEIRFWAKVDKSGGASACWPWIGAHDRKGYGAFNDGHKRVTATRWLWESTHGPISDGLFVCHHCDNPPCCNPRHLFLGTVQENTQDMHQKGRYKHQAAIGERNQAAKLTEADVLIIRAARSSGASTRELMARYGLSKTQINSVVARRSWKHVA